MAGRIHQVEDIILAIERLVIKPHRLRLDGDAALLLDIHVVEHLLGHVPRGHGPRLLDKAVGERRFAVVDMRDNREIADSVDGFLRHAAHVEQSVAKGNAASRPPRLTSVEAPLFLIVDDNLSNEIERRIAERLKLRRAALGLTLDQLAESAGVSRAMISKIERMESSPTASLLGKLTAALGLTMPALFAEERHAGPLMRRDEQPVWRDPETGYVRRDLTPFGGLPLSLVEIELPPGASIGFDVRSAGGASDRACARWCLGRGDRWDTASSSCRG